MLRTDVRRRLLSAGVALALSVPAAVALPTMAHATTVPGDTTTALRTTSFQVLDRGSRGDRVTKVQKWLEIRRTGFYGERTAKTVRSFQHRRDLPTTGRVGERTWTALSRRWSRIQTDYSRVLTVARNQFGDPYVYGAAGPGAFDCSGYTLYVYRQAAGIAMPHSAALQYRMSQHITRAQARPGDLVFFHSGGSIYHAALYAGHGAVYHSARPGTVVGREHIWTSSVYYGRVIGNG
jgi:cell wall-associated NlpC family hydrolase